MNTCTYDIIFVPLRDFLLLLVMRYKKSLILLLFLASSGMGFAFTRLNAETEHYVTFNGNLGYANLFNSIKGQAATPGLETELGAGYRIFHNDFLFTTGLGLSYNFYSGSQPIVITDINMIDTEGEPFNMHVYVSHQQDFTHAVNLNIPLLVGGEWGRFNFLVGPKIAYTLYGATSAKALCTTSGIYTRFYDSFSDMPNHSFETEQEITNGGYQKLKWNINLIAHAEIGWRIGGEQLAKKYNVQPEKVTYFISLYADYGLLNLNSVPADAENTFYYKQTDEGVKYYVSPLLLSQPAYNARFNNFNIGVKFTVLLQLPVAPKQYIYDGTKNTVNWKRGGTQAIKN